MNLKAEICCYAVAALAASSVIFATPVIAHDSADADASMAHFGKPAPGTQVVDSRGTVVGNLLVGGEVTRKINGIWISFSGPIRDGIVTELLSNINFYYTSSNCTGTAYLDATLLPIPGYPVGQETVSKTVTIYYPAPPYQSLPISSRAVVGVPNNCQTFAQPFMDDVGVVATTPLTVVPPLSVQ